MSQFKEWMKRIQDRGLHEKCHILAGISPLNSERIILQLKEKNLPKVPIPDVLIDRITKSKDPDEDGIRICVEQIKELKEGMDVEGKFTQLVDRAGLSSRPKVE